MAAFTGTQTQLSSRMSRFDVFRESTFWDQLAADQKRGSLQNENPMSINGRNAWDVCGVVREKWHSIRPSVQIHLNNRAAKIFKPLQGRQIEYAYSLYMTGTLENFRPTVVAFCMYLEIAERVIKAVGEKLKCFRPRLGFGYLATNFRIVLLMESAQPVNRGLWRKDDQGRPYQLFEINGSCLT
jgi:hypothetical protein